MNIYDGFGFTGQPFKLIYQDTIGFLQGNALCLWNLETNKKDGFQCFCANYKKRLIAVAEYGLNPLVYVYNYPQREVVMTLKGVSDLQILMMDISFDGQYLLAVNAVPKYEITVWDITSGERVQGESSTLPLRLNFVRGEFCPTSPTRFCLMYQKSLLLYDMVPSFEKVHEEGLQKNIKMELLGQYQLDGKPSFIVWDFLSATDTSDGSEQTNVYLVQGNRISYLNGNDLKEITFFDYAQPIKHLLATQKHLIVVDHSGLMSWLFKYTPVNIDDQTLLPFKLSQQYTAIAEDNPEKNITHLIYNHQYSRLIVGLADASIIILPIAAESSMEDEDDVDPNKDRGEDEHEEGAVKIHEVEATKLGPYQRGVVSFLKEFNNVNVLVSACGSGNIAFWDIVRRDVITSFNEEGKITCGDLSQNDQMLVTGSDHGVLRIYNIANIRKPVLLRLIKLFTNKPITNIAFNPQHNTIAVCSTDSPKVFFLASQTQTLIGYVELPVLCNAIAWNTSTKQVIGQGQPAMLFAVTSFLLISIVPPDHTQSYQQLKLEYDVCQVYGRKIDPDQTLIQINPLGGEALTAGKDKVFKKYKQPEEQLQKMDLKLKVASQGPLDEQDGHLLPPSCFALQVKQNILYSGAQDGSLMARSSDRIGQDVKSFKGHSLRQGGVSAIAASNRYKMIYSGDYDGGIFWWTAEKIKASESDAEKVMKNVFDVPEGVEDLPDSQVKHYQQVLEEEYMESQAPIREQQKKEKKELLAEIKRKLDKLIDHNNNADELEKLDRDEFVIDIGSRDLILENGAKQRLLLREQVKRENFRQEILYKLIKERTWDNMEVHLRGVNGLNSNILVYNYHIRIRSAQELRKLSLVKQFRRQEIKEKQLRREKKQNEIWALEDHVTDPKQYLVNALPGPQTLVLTDYEKKEDPMPQVGAKGGQPGAKAGPAAKAPARGAAAAKGMAAKPQEQKKDEEQERLEKEKEEKERQQKQEEKKEGQEEYNDWEYLYGVFELFSNNRKRNQMVLIGNIIFNIKRAFNVEFEKAMQGRQSELDNINERNKRIAEILNELKKPVELFHPKKNILENPESVLTVTNDDIPFERYLTKDERERKEAERKKEEDRLRALMADDSGVRAIKDMMGGTLDEKKETPLDEKLEVEEWMSKPQEEMTEDERTKFKEFEVKKARLEEEKEKIRKNLENELKKLRNEILEICFRFDEKLLILFRRKLEYDYRIYEQELYIIRLALSIIMQAEATVKIKDLKHLMEELTVKEKQAQMMKDELDNMKKEVEGQRQRAIDQMNQAFNVRSNFGFDAGKIKNVWVYAFEELKKDDKKRKELDKRLMADPQYKDTLIDVDPLLEFEKRELKRGKDTIFETYIKDIQEKVQNLQLFDYNDTGAREFTLSTLQNRFVAKKDFERLDSELNDLKTFSQFSESELAHIETNLTTSRTDHEDITTMMEKSKSNVEVLIRFKQGFVEISQDKPVPNLSEAVLIPKDAIDVKNNEIKRQGVRKIELMEEIKKIKFDVAKSEYELKRRDLIIKDLECKTREVQLLKVKKEMQVALTKKDTRLNEQELKNLQDQIDMLRQATEKRIMIYQKKEEKIKKDIEFIMKENEQLLAQGANLNVSVKQLQEISDMTFKKNAKQSQGVDEATDNQAFDKFKQISVNRKYFDLAKKQTEEIELLREELNKLKARTFANFSNVTR